MINMNSDPQIPCEPQPISCWWYEAIERVETSAPPGTRFLVRRHSAHHHGHDTVIDYITVRTESGWEHITVGYLKGESSPYPAHYDGNRHHRAPRRLMTPLGQSIAARIFLQQDQ